MVQLLEKPSIFHPRSNHGKTAVTSTTPNSQEVLNSSMKSLRARLECWSIQEIRMVSYQPKEHSDGSTHSKEQKLLPGEHGKTQKIKLLDTSGNSMALTSVPFTALATWSQWTKAREPSNLSSTGSRTSLLIQSGLLPKKIKKLSSNEIGYNIFKI